MSKGFPGSVVLTQDSPGVRVDPMPISPSLILQTDICFAYTIALHSSSPFYLHPETHPRVFREWYYAEGWDDLLSG